MMLQVVLVRHKAGEGLAWENEFMAFTDFYSHVLKNNVLLVFEL